jgi:hypothetical protein
MTLNHWNEYMREAISHCLAPYSAGVRASRVRTNQAPVCHPGRHAEGNREAVPNLTKRSERDHLAGKDGKVLAMDIDLTATVEALKAPPYRLLRNPA